MTKNQIDFVEHKENVRHNKTVEAETGRHNTQQEGIGWYQASTAAGQLAEMKRHNLTDEQIRSTLAEHQGSYWDAQSEAAISNAATNAYNAQLRGQELEESIRHALVEEGYDASRAQSYASMAAAALQQAETAESTRKDAWGHQFVNIGAGAISQGVESLTSLANSIIRSGGTISIGGNK